MPASNRPDPLSRSIGYIGDVGQTLSFLRCHPVEHVDVHADITASFVHILQRAKVAVVSHRNHSAVGMCRNGEQHRPLFGLCVTPMFLIVFDIHTRVLQTIKKSGDSANVSGIPGLFLVAGLGFEPRQTESESVVLPLHNPATALSIIMLCFKKSRPFAAFLRRPSLRHILRDQGKAIRE